MLTKPKKNSFSNVTRKSGYRSGLEEVVARQLVGRDIPFEYETLKIKFSKPPKSCTYTPDFILPNGIIIETKGRLMPEDREKHLLIKAQYPELDIRFVFTNSKNKINKGSPTTYREWCDKNNYKWADRVIPREWFLEMREQ